MYAQVKIITSHCRTPEYLISKSRRQPVIILSRAGSMYFKDSFKEGAGNGSSSLPEVILSSANTV